MSPSDNSSVELKTLWFIEGVPLWIKQLTLISIITLGLALIIDLINKRSKKGILIISNEQIEISTRKKSIQLKYDDIKEVAFIGKGIIYGTEHQSEKLKILFKSKNDEVTRIKLSNYLLVDQLMDSLDMLTTKDIKVFSDNLDPYWPES